VGDILDIATVLGVIEKRGAFYRYNGDLIGQGRENAKQFLRENPEIALEMENVIRAEYGLPPIDEAAAED